MFNKYDAYKDSGIEWIGDIPCHWVRKKIKSIANIYNGDSLSPDMKAKFSISSDCSNPYVSSKDINVDTSTLNYETGLSIPSYFSKYKLAPKNSVLLCIEGGSAGRKIAFTETEVNFVNKLACFYSMKMSNKFIFYYLKSQPFQVQFKLALSGLIGGVSLSSLENFEIYQPSKTEQDQIVTFLDKKITELDQAIAIKEQQIALLNERKQIVIQKAVTQGLNPNVSMKDSGVEWIGQIPEHWTITKLKRLTRQIVDGAHFTPTYVDHGIPFLRVTDLTSMQNGKIEWDKVRYIPEREHLELIKRAKPEKGDILLSKNGTIGVTKVIDWDSEFSIFVSLCLIKLRSSLEARYFEAFFNSPIVDKQISFGSSRTSVTNLHLEKIKELLIILPPKDEQIAILKHIEEQSFRFDEAVKNYSEQIEKLKEYKTTLINDAVTGKIKVA